jgi:hypothetical protein
VLTVARVVRQSEEGLPVSVRRRAFALLFGVPAILAVVAAVVAAVAAIAAIAK